MLEVIETNRCCGCAACVNACPKKAISIVQDENGFYKHHIDQKLCVNCGLCQKVCPLLNFASKNYEVPSCYAVMADDELRAKSSSGGAFGIIAHEILNLNGVVCGAAFDDEWHVKHIIVDNVNDLQKLHGSKYVQSYISADLFQQIKKYLDEDRYVLFTGVPCQVAGLRNFLRKEYEKLYTADLICAYAPSPKVFDTYLSENYDKKKIDKINFRDKTMFGWSCTVVVDVGSDRILDYKYMTPYLNRMFKGEHCVNCAYKKFPRPGDFTIGDFWKIHEFTKDMDDRKGTSALVLNSAKAEKLFETFRHKFKKIKAMPFKGVSWQIDVPHKIHRTLECQSFYRNMQRYNNYTDSVKNATKNSRVGIINWWFINNRGAILTNYALNEMVKSLGFNAYTVNYITPFERDNYQKGYVKDFTDKYIQKTRWIENRYDLGQLNADIGTFICGSDQIFNFFPCNAHSKIFYMDWVDVKNNKLLSYAASFAGNEFKATESQTNLVKYLLSRFDYHSIREEEGVEIMRQTFGLDSQLILDPVFCIDKQKYIDMAEKSTDKTEEDFIVYYYTVPDRIKNAELIDHVMKKAGAKRAINLFSWDIPMENWFWYFLHAKFVLTNSFHGVCFSLIFNKPWVAFVLDGKKDSRFSILTKLSNMKERIFYDMNDIFKADYLFQPVDFSYFNHSIGAKVQEAYQWLEKALNTPKTYKLSPEAEMYDALLGDYNEKIKKALGYTWTCEQRIKQLEEKIKNLEVSAATPEKP